MEADAGVTPRGGGGSPSSATSSLPPPPVMPSTHPCSETVLLCGVLRRRYPAVFVLLSAFFLMSAMWARVLLQHDTSQIDSFRANIQRDLREHIVDEARYRDAGVFKYSYYIAANLFNNEAILPQFHDQLLLLARILGPNNIYVSIFENGSTDKTIQYLSILRHSLERLGIAHNINSLPGDWRQFCDQIVDATQRIQCQTHGCTTLRSCPVWIRIPLMAAIRNMALLPLLNASSVREAASRLAGRTPVPPTVGEPSLNSPISPFAPFVGDPLDAARAHAAAEGSSGAVGDLPRATVQMQSLVGSTQHLGLPRPVRVVFLNDVILYAEDVLELIATHNGNYDMACAMDFERLKFYDTWVARDMSGSSFSDWYPFVREAVAQERLRQREPFRVFSCWNGAVVVPAHAITLNGILFRSWMPAELRSLRPRAPPENVFSSEACPASECQLFCKDLWQVGRRRIYMNPRVQLYYNHGTEAFQRLLMRFVNPLMLSWSNRIQQTHTSLRADQIVRKAGTQVDWMDPAFDDSSPDTLPADISCGLSEDSLTAMAHMQAT